MASHRPTVSGIQTVATTPMGEERVIPASVRPDGTVRKQIKVRPGFVPQEDRTVFKASRIVQAESRPKIPGLVSTPPSTESQVDKPKSKNQKRNENKKLKKILNELQDAPSSSPASTTTTTPIQNTPTESSAVPVENKIKNLRKKLRQIEDLNEKKCSGVTLLPEQQAKLDSKESVEQELNELLSKLNIE